jgi:alpha-acetolactate decarboxylase
MIFSGASEESLNTAMQDFTLESVSDPGEMLNILTESKLNGTAVGIYAPVLGNEIYVTAVEDVLIDDEITIILDVTGYILEKNKLRLDEISSVCAFKSPFQNPFMKTLKSSKA